MHHGSFIFLSWTSTIAGGDVAVRRDRDLLEHAGPPVWMQPLDRRLLVAEFGGEQDVLAEPNDVVEPERPNLLVSLLVAKASIGREGHVHRLGDALPELVQQLALVLVAAPLERGLVHRLP
jgi:hypothetical protein